MIRGRAAAGDSNPHVSLAAQPRVTRALQRATVVVGGAGVAAVLALGLGSSMMSAAAEAAASAGGGYGGGGGGADDDATVSELAATDAVEASPVEVDPIAAPTALVDVSVTDVFVAPGQVLRARSDLQGIVAPSTTTTTLPPTTTVPPAPAAPTPDPGSVEAIIHEIFGPAGDQAVRVARCESGLNPGAISRGGGNWGLFQINTVHRHRVQRMGYQWEDMLDARANAVVAYSIFQEQGWSPWGCRHAA